MGKEGVGAAAADADREGCCERGFLVIVDADVSPAAAVAGYPGCSGRGGMCCCVRGRGGRGNGNIKAMFRRACRTRIAAHHSPAYPAVVLALRQWVEGLFAFRTGADGRVVFPGDDGLLEDFALVAERIGDAAGEGGF